MTATCHFFDAFKADIGLGKHNLNTDTLKWVLTDTAPVATNTVLSNITQIANGNGYTTDGAASTGQSYSQTSGTATLSLTAPSWTGSGSGMGQFRYWVLYNATSATKPLIAWFDYHDINPTQPEIALASGETFTIVDSTVLTLT